MIVFLSKKNMLFKCKIFTSYGENIVKKNLFVFCRWIFQQHLRNAHHIPLRCQAGTAVLIYNWRDDILWILFWGGDCWGGSAVCLRHITPNETAENIWKIYGTRGTRMKSVSSVGCCNMKMSLAENHHIPACGAYTTYTHSMTTRNNERNAIFICANLQYIQQIRNTYIRKTFSVYLW